MKNVDFYLKLVTFTGGNIRQEKADIICVYILYTIGTINSLVLSYYPALLSFNYRRLFAIQLLTSELFVFTKSVD